MYEPVIDPTLNQGVPVTGVTARRRMPIPPAASLVGMPGPYSSGRISTVFLSQSAVTVVPSEKVVRSRR
jgi:hypothetical protein